jgi:hypothetical protein
MIEAILKFNRQGLVINAGKEHIVASRFCTRKFSASTKNHAKRARYVPGQGLTAPFSGAYFLGAGYLGLKPPGYPTRQLRCPGTCGHAKVSFQIWKFCGLKNGPVFRGKVTSHPACRKISSGGLFSTPRFPRRPMIMVRAETAPNAISGGAGRKV